MQQHARVQLGMVMHSRESRLQHNAACAMYFARFSHPSLMSLPERIQECKTAVPARLIRPHLPHKVLVPGFQAWRSPHPAALMHSSPKQLHAPQQ